MRVRGACGFLAALCASTSLCAASAQTAANDSPAELLAKHRSFVGWQLGDGTFKALKVTGTISRSRPDGTESVVSRFVDLRAGLVDHRTDNALDSGFRHDSGFSGKIFWYSDENGFTVTRAGEERKRVLVENAILNEATTTLSAVVISEQTTDGREVAVLRESMPDGYAFDLYEDAASGAYLRAIIDPQGLATTMVIDRYGPVGTSRRAIAAWHDDATHRTTTFAYEPNVRLIPSELDPPGPHAKWSFVSDPFALKTTDEGLLVDALVGGVRGHFLLASVARMVSVSKDFATRAKLQPLADRPNLTKIPTLRFDDGSTLNDVVVGNNFADPLGRDDVDGVLGFDFFAGAVIDLDLDSGKITLFDPSKAGVNKDSSVSALDLAYGVPEVSVKIDKQNIVDAVLDTTGGDAIALPGMLSPSVALHQPPGTTDPNAPSRCGLLDNVQIGVVSYDAQPACFVQDDSNEASLGYDFLRQLNVTFDYPDAAVVLVPRRPKVSQASQKTPGR